MTGNTQGKMLVFLSLYDPGYSRTWNIYSFLSKRSLHVSFEKINSTSMMRDLLTIKKKLRDRDVTLIVSSPSQLLVLPVILIFSKRPILDAGWSLFESTITSKRRAGFLLQKACKTYFIDLLGSHLSKKVILESELQRKWYAKVFLVNKSKCFVNYTGVDEASMPITNQTGQTREIFQSCTSLHIVFRGKDNTEAGLSILAACTKLLVNEDIEFLVISPGLLPRYEFSDKTQLLTEVYESKAILGELMRMGDISLGQLALHKRTERTIPHKAFESAFLGVPYLSARNKGVLEVFTEGKDIYCFDPGSAEDLAKKIIELKYSPTLRKSLQDCISETYEIKLSQERISTNFLRIIGI